MKNLFNPYLVICVLVCGCRPMAQSTSSLAVIDGEPVTKPEQAPGTYGVQFWKEGKPVGVASVVAVGPNTFLSNGHVVNGTGFADNVRIVDYTGQVVTQFNPNDNTQVQKVVNQKFLSNNQMDSMSNDIGAFVVKSNIPTQNFTQGFLPVATRPLQAGDNISLAGNGISDYRVFQDPAQYQNERSGILRYGTNQIAETGDGLAYINGNAFRTPGDGQSVSGPGDSGGAVIYSDSNKNQTLSAIMSSGKMFNPQNQENPYFDYKNNPSAISSQPNSAFSRLVDMSQQNAFLQTVSQNGGNFTSYAPPNVVPSRTGNSVPVVGE